MKIGMIFPWQGAQFLGMGKEFYDKERIVQEFFEQASSCLDQNFVRLCFASSEEELRKTANTQTSIFLIGASIYKLLSEKYGIVPDIVAGHSLGEYSALFAAGGINFSDGLYLLKKRSQFMEEAVKQNPGGMISIIGLPFEVISKICERYDDPSSLRSVAQLVNVNSPSQVVVSGTLPELEQIKLDVKEIKGKAIPLKVDGAFHSRLMESAEKEFSQYMLKVDFNHLKIPMVNNLQAKLILDSQDVKDSLLKQMSSPVLWWQSMEYFKDLDFIIQVGPGDSMAKLLKREWPEKKILSVNKPEDIENLFNVLDLKMPIDKSEFEKKKEEPKDKTLNVDKDKNINEAAL